MLDHLITLGDKIEITQSDYSFSGQDQERIYISQVLDKEEDCLKIAAPIESGKIIPLSVGKDYMLCFYTDKGLYRCKAKIIDRYKVDNNKHILSVECLTKLEKYQRRQFFRLDYGITFEFKYVLDEDKWLKGTILDLSGGGLRFVSKEKIECPQTIICKIILEQEDMPMLVTGKILTKSSVGTEEERNEYRVEFENMEEVEREQIIKFIFEEERRRRKKEKGMI